MKFTLLITFIICLSFVIQYNPYYLSNYLWTTYWTGSSIRTSVSLVTIFIIFFLFFFKRVKINNLILSYIAILLIVISYGLLMSFFNDNLNKSTLADIIFWIEIVCYLIVFSLFKEEKLKFFLKFFFYTTGLFCVFSIYLYFTLIDNIAVAALVGDQRIVRLTDLLAPLIFVSYFFYFDEFKKIDLFFFIIIIITILLGFYRSVWAALILTFFIIYFNKFFKLKFLFSFIPFFLFFIYSFEIAFEYFFDVKDVLTGRILAAVGTADSVGRVETAFSVIKQFVNSDFLLLGNGFGSYAVFINDFGYGPVLKAQPVGSLSNFYVSFIYMTGIVGFIFLILFFFKILLPSYISQKKYGPVGFVLTYIFLQFLTFPSTIHFPVALIISLIFNLNIAILQNKKNLV